MVIDVSKKTDTFSRWLEESASLIRRSPGELLKISLKPLGRKVVKPASDGIDVHERQAVVVRPVREQNKGRPLHGIDPKARARKPKMAKALR